MNGEATHCPNDKTNNFITYNCVSNSYTMSTINNGIRMGTNKPTLANDLAILLRIT